MHFASRNFFIFLMVVLLIYHSLRTRTHKYAFLLGASWLFYMSWNPWFIWVILFTSAVDYYAGRLIESAPTEKRRKSWLLLSVATNVGFLCFFKYTNFFLDNGTSLLRELGMPVPDLTLRILLPLGISFHTFQGISYTLDVYRGKTPAVRSFLDFALFVAFFPQLLAGPIVRGVEFLPQMVTPPRVSSRQIVEGLHWFLLGLFKKAFLADRLATFVDAVFKNPGSFDGVTQRWAVVAYAAQIYCDFSGYSDLAIGCAKWFGFELPQNFNFPYLARSITDFWRRWHISLSTWIRDYLYIPMGGNRNGTVRTYVNLMVAMTLCGLWHGASWFYIAWGLYNGVLLSLHRIYDRAVSGKPIVERLRRNLAFQTCAVASTFLMVCVGLVLVRSESWSACLLLERALVDWSAGAMATRFVPAWVPLLIGMVMAGHLFSGLRDRRCGVLELPPFVRAWAYVVVVVLLVAFGPGANQKFIYFQF